MSKGFSSLVKLLRWRAQHQPEHHAYTFLHDDGTEEVRLTYGALDEQARAIAARLQSLGLRGGRVLLLYPAGLDFVAAFFGCLYAGVIAVPAYPPRRSQKLARLQAIAADAQATVALTTNSLLADIARRQELHGNLAALSWLATDSLPTGLSEEWQEHAVDRDALAFLQYTSGSTGAPKGVMVTHGNLLHNAEMVRQAFGHSEGTIVVGWLPLFHDMGLVGNVLQPLYLGTPSILMSPVAFLQKPIRWLEAITRYKATTSGGPDFAYGLCARMIPPEQRAGLDLGSWEVAFNGAEPVRAETLERFTTAFAPHGFRRESFYPCYGLAEATLFVSGGVKEEPPVLRSVDGAALEQNRVVVADDGQEGVKTIVSCGHSWLDQTLVIVDPASRALCTEEQVGEIWVSGPSVAQGYWNRSGLTEESFQAALVDSGAGPFLRTGDLGFLKEGELFVTGRLKDLIIIRGRNHYPQDIEQTVEESHPALRPGCGAAFTVEIGNEERLVIVQEVERSYLRKLDEEVVMGAIRQAVSEEHELQAHAVVLLKTASIPKTSSGKIQRHLCRAKFLDGTLNTVASHTFAHAYDTVVGPPLGQETGPEGTQRGRQMVLGEALREMLAGVLKIPVSEVDEQQALNTLGLDSLQAIQLKHQMEATHGVEVTIEQFFDGLTLRQLVDQILAGRAERVLDSPARPLPLPCSQAVAGGKMQRYEIRRQPDVAEVDNGMGFSLLYFSSNAAAYEDDRYRLLIDGAKFADQNDFTAVWIPERHFHPFGGIYPNPSVLASALAMVTKRVRLRAGSVVLPLHDPIRVAEEWAVVDNLSHGRVDLAFARGWNPNDFVLSPESYANRTELFYAGIQTVQKLWRGEPLLRTSGVGEETEIIIYPPPKQPELSIWITCSGGRERFIEAGKVGANVLTALLFQPVEELAEKIVLYRTARAEHGYDPDAGQVTLMLHTFIGETLVEVREKVREPFTDYLRSSVTLWRQASTSLSELSEREQDDVLAYAFERYFQTAALFGTVESGLSMVRRFEAIGVNEIACLIDFGVDVEAVMASLHSLNTLRERAQASDADEEALLQDLGRSGTIGARDAEQLLAQLDQLSDEEVDSLLDALRGQEEVAE